MKRITLKSRWLWLVAMIIVFGLVQRSSATSVQQISSAPYEVLVADSIHKKDIPIDSTDKDTLEKQTNREIRSVSQRTWVESTYKKVTYLPSKDYESNHLGLYYSRQKHLDAAAWSALGYKSVSEGFALQFMSGNRLKGEDFSLYGGLEFGVQYFNHSSIDSIIVNLADHKLAESFIRSRTTDLAMRWQFEYSQHRVKPYAAASIGARLMTTQQKVSQIKVEGMYDRSNVHGISNRSAALGTVALGAKFMITPWLALDVRKEWSVGSNDVEIVDYKNTNIEGILYAPDVQKGSLGSSQFKVGVVFNFGKEDTRIVLDEEGHYEYSCLPVATDAASNNVQILCNNFNQTVFQNNQSACKTDKQLHTSDSIGYEKVVAQTYWVDDYKDYRAIIPERDFSRGFMGIHYMQLNHFKGSDWKSLGYQDSIKNKGISLQFMSKNVSSIRNVGLYFGFDVSVHLWSRSARDTLFIDSDNIDAGYGYNVARSGDMLVRTAIEYNRFRLVPYATLGVGVRMFDMNANVKGMLNSREYESNYEDRLSSATAAVTFGYGSRLKLSKFIHLDVRQEWAVALTKFKVLPLGEYDDRSKITKLRLNTMQLKLGLIFDLSYGNTEYAIVEPAHQMTVSSEILCNYDLDSSSQGSNSFLSLTEINSIEPCDSNVNPKIYRQRTGRKPSQKEKFRDAPRNQRKPTTKTPSRKKPFPGVRKKKEISW